jgi:integrase/recombinase XerD
MKLSTAVDEFLLALQAEAKSPNTVNWYRHVLQLIIREYKGVNVDDITASDMRRFMVTILRSDRTQTTAHSYHTALRRFFGWAAIEWGLKSPMRNIAAPTLPDKKPVSVSPEDFVKLFDACGLDAYGDRDRCMFGFGADTGVRRGGIQSLLIDNLDLTARRAYVTEKGNSDRWVYFTWPIVRLFRQWLKVRPYCDVPNVFVSMQPGREPAPLTGSGIYQVYRRRKVDAGITGRVNPHSFRHNFAREYLLSGGDAVTLAALMGWKNIETAKAYAIFEHSELQGLQEEHSPYKRLIKQK